VGLATVLSHEIAHIVAKHHEEKNSYKLLFDLADILLWPEMVLSYFGIDVSLREWLGKYAV
jgi:Zn-dependent protease with chaperone function